MNQLYRFLLGNAEAVLFVAVFAEQIGLPLPAIPILLAAGALVAEGTLDPLAAVGITVVASVLADLIWYYLGLRSGSGLLRFFRRLSWCNRSDIEKTERFFSAHSTFAVTGAKFVPWLGFLIPPLAGMFRVRLGRFLAFDTLGSLLYAVVYLALGFVFGHEFHRMLQHAQQFSYGTIAVLLLLGVVVVWHKTAHRRKGSVPTSDLVPSAGTSPQRGI
jgi:membrane protein DedA with SNARE-associated domain